MKNPDHTPITCSLATAELSNRETTLFAQFLAVVTETEELQDGYAFRLPGDTQWIELLAQLLVAERECCPFLTFELSALPNRGPVLVRVTGPVGTKDFLRTVLLVHERST